MLSGDEELTAPVVPDMLELWFEKTWVLPDQVDLIPEEQAAIVTFTDPKGPSLTS